MSGSGDVERLNGVDDESLPLLVPLLTDLNFSFLNGNGTNSTLFEAAAGGIFRFYKHKIKKSKERKDNLKSVVVDYYKPKLDENKKGKWRRVAKASKLL